MEQEEKMTQHIQLPHMEAVTPKDKLVYLTIKSFQNKETRACFPSHDAIAKRCGASAPTVRKSIKALEEAGYIHVNRDNPRHHIYTFDPYKKFEVFSYEFLNDTRTSFTEKSYLASVQEHLFKNGSTGNTTYSLTELSDKINMSASTISRCNNSLSNLGYLTIIKTASKDLETGIYKDEKIFNFALYNRAVCEAIITHENRITDIEELQEEQKKKIDRLEKQIQLLLNQDNDSELDVFNL